MYKKLVTQKKGVKDSPLDFVDISVSVTEGFRQEDMLKRLHAKLPNGEIISGVPAFITLWRQVPGFKGLAFLINLPFIKHLAIKVYDHILAPTLYKRYSEALKTGSNVIFKNTVLKMRSASVFKSIRMIDFIYV